MARTDAPLPGVKVAGLLLVVVVAVVVGDEAWAVLAGVVEFPVGNGATGGITVMAGMLETGALVAGALVAGVLDAGVLVVASLVVVVEAELEAGAVDDWATTDPPVAAAEARLRVLLPAH